MFTISWKMIHLPLRSFPWILGTLLPSVVHLLWRLTSFKPSSSPHPSTQKDFSVRKEFQSCSQQIITYPLPPWKADALGTYFWGGFFCHWVNKVSQLLLGSALGSLLSQVSHQSRQQPSLSVKFFSHSELYQNIYLTDIWQPQEGSMHLMLYWDYVRWWPLRRPKGWEKEPGCNQNILKKQWVTYIRKKTFSGTKRRKLRVTAKEGCFNSCSLVEEQSWKNTKEDLE